MIQVNFNEDCDSVADGLYISVFRRLALDNEMMEICDVWKEKWKGKEIISTGGFVKQFLELAQSDKELLYVAYCAGEKVTELVNAEMGSNNDFSDLFDDDDLP